MRRAVVVICSLVVLAVGCAGESPEVPAGPDGSADPVLLTGRDIFSTRCATCHGADGGGGQGPKLDDGRVLDSFPDLADQVTVIGEGRGAMPGFDGLLSHEEIEAVVRYTREVLGPGDRR